MAHCQREVPDDSGTAEGSEAVAELMPVLCVVCLSHRFGAFLIDEGLALPGETLTVRTELSCLACPHSILSPSLSQAQHTEALQ